MLWGSETTQLKLFAPYQLQQSIFAQCCQSHCFSSQPLEHPSPPYLAPSTGQPAFNPVSYSYQFSMREASSPAKVCSLTPDRQCGIILILLTENYYTTKSTGWTDSSLNSQSMAPLRRRCNDGDDATATTMRRCDGYDDATMLMMRRRWRRCGDDDDAMTTMMRYDDATTTAVPPSTNSCYFGLHPRQSFNWHTP